MKHKAWLHFFLVLSIISAGSTIFSDLMFALFMPQLDRVYTALAQTGTFPHEIFTAWEQAKAIPRPYYGAMAALAILSLTGCILMWKLRRSGFHCYTLAQLLMLLLPVLFLGVGSLGLGDVMFTLLFVVVYYMLLKNLGAFDTTQESNDDIDPAERLEQ